MIIAPVLPPKDDAAAKEVGIKLVQTAQALGVQLDPQAFIMAWLGSSTRVFVATDEEHKPLGLGVMAFGTRFYDPDVSATVLVAAGPARQELLAQMRDAAKMLGAVAMFYEAADGDTLGGKTTTLRELEL